MKRKIPSLDTRYSKHRPVSEDEVKIWQEAVTEFKPPAPAKRERAKPRSETVAPPPVKKKRAPDSQAKVIDRATAAKIRRGALTIDATLDLHGLTAETAPVHLARFLGKAQSSGFRTVLVITGKGSGDKGGTLRRMLPFWLNETPLREFIIAYDNAGPRHGGDGAWYVRIRNSGRRT